MPLSWLSFAQRIKDLRNRKLYAVEKPYKHPVRLAAHRRRRGIAAQARCNRPEQRFLTGIRALAHQACMPRRRVRSKLSKTLPARLDAIRRTAGVGTDGLEF